MINLLLKALDQNKYTSESPVYKRYSPSVYQNFMQERFPEFTEYFGENFDEFIINLKRHMDSETACVDLLKKYDSEFNTLSSLLEIMEDLTGALIKNEENIIIMTMQMICYYVHLLTLISIKNKALIYQKEDALSFLEKKIQFSQTAIAKEWEIDNDTLSKWFQIIYQSNPFAGRKRINLPEYLKIYNDFFIREKDRRNTDTEFMISDVNLGYYVSAAIKGRTYSKREIIEMGFNLDELPAPRHYAQAKKILAGKYHYYSIVNKFPHSLAIELIEELKTRS